MTITENTKLNKNLKSLSTKREDTIMSKRRLQNKTTVPELEFPVELTIYTRCPAKWKLVDLETGEEYVGLEPIDRKKNQHWKKIK